ncbi:MAG: hypothetical protein JEZ02_05115 [Desulfatibacillum sp.]|nr:hypothetical protein [Desulfatibacillum sp.]
MDYTNLKTMFDDVLQSHFERLIGTRVGMRGLPITLETITALVLLAERIEDAGDDPSKYHSRETLCQEMAEVGLQSAEEQKVALQLMEEKGYIKVLESGGLESSEDVPTMTRALDKVFPQMPGMLLVAYYVQTLQEVVSGRKEEDHAVDQFDQALTMHGMSAKRDKQGDAKPAKEDVAKKRLESLRRLSAARVSAARQKEAESYSMANLGDPLQEQLSRPNQFDSMGQETQTPPAMETPPEIAEQPMEAEPSQEIEIANVDDRAVVAPGEEEPLQEMEKPGSVEARQEHDTRDASPREEDIGQADTSIEDAPVEEEIEETEPELPEVSEHPVPDEEPEVDPVAMDSEGGAQTESFDAVQGAPPPAPPEIGDADIMERVAEFEQALAMTCPLCGEGKVKEQQTSMGKIFFACTQKACQFISWGRPHHIVCPQCSNPFLVEGSALEGAAILKCPRATCNHVQQIGGESGSEGDSPKKKKKRRVVRRRVAKK